MIDRLRQMSAHARWADTTLLQTIVAVPETPGAVLRECSHVLGACETWLSRIEGRQAGVPVWPELSLEDVIALNETVHEAYGAYLRGLDLSDLDRRVDYKNTAGIAFTNTVADILTQVYTHGHYHRGKANLLLRQAGLTPVSIDYIAWVRSQPATTAKI